MILFWQIQEYRETSGKRSVLKQYFGIGLDIPDAGYTSLSKGLKHVLLFNL